MKPKKWKNKNFWEALKHSLSGMKYLLQTEKNLKIQLIIAMLVMIISFLLKLTAIQWLILCLTIGNVLFAEIINTAIEIVLDLYSEKYNEKIKIAKDIASSAVLLTSIIAVIIAGILYIPKILNYIK